MLPLYEMMMRAQNGEAMRAFAGQFGMSEEQVNRAMEALMPAFATGLKRSTASPQGIGEFMQALTMGHYADYFNDLAAAFTPQGIAEGNAMLGRIFGSKDVSRAIANQAAMATGIAQDVFKQMMPAVASILMGGLFNQASAAGSKPDTGNPVADMFGQMMAQTAQSQKQAAEFTGQLGKMMEETFGGSAARSNDKPQALNPFTDMMETMMKNGFPGMAQPAEPEKEENPYSKMISDMFDAGTKVQKEYQKNVDAVFDSYMKNLGGKS
ncbi:DUF937 domain-containing protein [Hoeflea prorocentri]|uniref:DUF937 domain-containing protein n=1 Tax=Hoeflea prorocentri TaxID=1922333 RepID=A0A9X3ZIX6_9HYPH|nr:DUF937 domain-containing protein [Hoeflea prorocentri]MCY6382336.1 DUF937 domain-containing protein [Hoeflea prorocentri]MDA5400136.1 DUF937 domain-containing protein [Hoeflea prorocentri]